jgi:Uma2 family endonuclease
MDWISNGAPLAWLIDPYERQVFVYRPGQEPQRVTGRLVTGEGPVDSFELNLGPVWKCYED